MVTSSSTKFALLQIVIIFSIILANSSSSSSKNSKTIVISGSGPASLMFSYSYLKQSPFTDVQIYILEKSKDPPKCYNDFAENNMELDKEVSYAFGFRLGNRSFSHLERDGSEEFAEKVRQISVNTPKGSPLYMTNRRDMVAEMTSALLREFGDRVKITYGAQCLNVNEDGTAIKALVSEEDQNADHRQSYRTIPYDLLLVGDGISSTIREDLVQRGFIKRKRYFRNVSWKALQLPPQPNIDPNSFTPFQHFKDKSKAPDEWGAIMPRFKNRHVLLTFWKQNHTNPFQSTSIEEFKLGLHNIFPNITLFPDDNFLQQYLDQRPGRESTMKLNRHSVLSLKVALLGDASAGMYSFMGQGVASAMGRSSRLASIISSTPLDNDKHIRKALKAFSIESVKEANAIVDLNLLSHLEYNKYFRRYAPDYSKLGPMLNMPEMRYSDLAKKHRWKIVLSKLIWRCERVSMKSLK